MGRRLVAPGRRAALAFVLTLAALAIPSVSWHAVGSREAQREATRIEREPRELARQTSARLAESLARRLEALRDAESRRPFYHYQNLYHDPKSVSLGASVQPSPLAQGPSDPLVRAYFQIRGNGRLTLPTLNEKGLPIGPKSEAREQERIRQELEPAVGACLAAVRRHPAAEKTEIVASTEIKAVSSNPAQQSVQVEKLKPDAWMQNANVNELYTQLQQAQSLRPPVLPTPPPKRATPKEIASPKEIVVRIGPFGWHMIPLAEGSALAALREVVTPQGAQVQGFLVSASEISSTLGGSPFRAQFLPGPARREGESGIALDDSPWHVAIDSGSTLVAARGRADLVRAGFRSQFLGGMLAAAVAALAVLLLVLRTERLAQDRSRLAATAAHELRTPLAGLRMYGEMLSEGLGDPAKSREYAARIAGEAERLGRVVSNLLGFARLERRGLSIQKEPGDLAEAVRTCVERQRPALEAAGLRVEMDLPPGLALMQFDRDAVSQIVQNLLDNAEKYTRSSGDRRVRIALEQAPSAVALSVTDNGPGISPSARRRLFRPFAAGSRADGPEGLGLGLLLTRVLARAHGGDVVVGEAPGGGTLVTVSLPA